MDAAVGLITAAYALFASSRRECTSARLAAAKVDVRLFARTMRVSPSIYNTQGDIDQLLNALS